MYCEYEIIVCDMSLTRANDELMMQFSGKWVCRYELILKLNNLAGILKTMEKYDNPQVLESMAQTKVLSAHFLIGRKKNMQS